MIAKFTSFLSKSTGPLGMGDGLGGFVRLLGLILVLLLLRCLWLWQPERQVQLHQDHLLDAAENRNWKRFTSFIDEHYSDRWDHDKQQLARDSSEVLRHYFGLRIQRDYRDLLCEHGKASVSLHLKLKGGGTPIAALVSARVNALSSPFTFYWEQRSWRPWDWQLVRADQPELTIACGESF